MATVPTLSFKVNLLKLRLRIRALFIHLRILVHFHFLMKSLIVGRQTFCSNFSCLYFVNTSVPCIPTIDLFMYRINYYLDVFIFFFWGGGVQCFTNFTKSSHFFPPKRPPYICLPFVNISFSNTLYLILKQVQQIETFRTILFT